MAEAGPRRYRAGDAADIALRPLDGLTLLYHRPSGATHMAAAPVPEILAALEDGPGDAAQVLGRLAARFELETDERDSLFATVEARLEELVALGLVERL